jgi:hypothetical protein
MAEPFPVKELTTRRGYFDNVLVDGKEYVLNADI